MEVLSVQHRIAALELLIKTESVTAKQRGFRQQFQRHMGPRLSTLLLWVSKWGQEGPVKDSKTRRRPLLARTPDNVERVKDTTLRIPRRSVRRLALALCSNEFSVRRILHKDSHYHSSKIQVAQELSGRDKVSRLQFCNEFLEMDKKNNSDIMNTWLSHEVHFNVPGYVNKQKRRYWSPKNPHERHQHLLHNAQVWCFFSWHYRSLFLWDWGGAYSNCECREI